jgi:cobalt-zinc-cadmium efflux system outer membrane protein
MNRISRVLVSASSLAVTATVLVGCAGTATPTEKQAKADLEAVQSIYRPGDAKPELPALKPESPLADVLGYAMLNNPRVEAAYYAWAASVARITTARSLPDPRLTFEADIMDVVTTLMPGLMIDLPGPGKLRAAGDVAAGESSAAYFAFESEVLRTAYAAKSAYIRLHFVSETIRVQQKTLALLGDLETAAQQRVGAGSGAIQDVLRAQIEREQLATQAANIEDSRSVLEAEYRAALGHAPSDLRIPTPIAFEREGDAPAAEDILAIAAARNPRLRQMEAEVRRGEAMLDLARSSRVPDFSLGLVADVKSSPVMWRPSASVTLPIWKDKIEAEIAAAQAESRSAEARLSAEQISLAAELASLLYMYRESTRNSDLFGTNLTLKARQVLEASRTGYATSRASYSDVIDAQRLLLEFELAEIEALTQRELALASISLLIAGTAPSGAPVRPAADSAPSDSTVQESHP